MHDNSNNNKRIAKNTLILFVRMAILMIISLYTSRVVLDALGVEDYGIYNAVGGFIAMFAMISNSLSSAISRYLTFYIGKGEDAELHIVFCTSLIIQLAICAIVLLFAETLGIWFLNCKMTIPDSRVFVSNWVFQFSIITFLFNLISIPYNACLIAHEKMGAFAYIGIFEGVSSLLVAIIIKYSPFDALLLYSILMCLVAIMTRIIYVHYCKRHFYECRFELIFKWGMIKEMFGFAGWNFIGSISGILSSQGLNILFNVFCGPIVNAARGIAVQVQSAVTRFTESFYTAVQPQITKSYASGDIIFSQQLTMRCSRLAFLLLLLVSLPIIFEINFILSLWLKVVPNYTSDFVKIILVTTLINSLSQPLIHLMLATGSIRNYQIVVGGINLVNFPVAWFLLGINLNVVYVQSTIVVFSLLALYARVAMLKNMIGFSMKKFFFSTFLRCVILFVFCSIPPYCITSFFETGLMRLTFNTLATL